MKCSIKDFETNITEQMLSHGKNSAIKGLKSPDLQRILIGHFKDNQFPMTVDTGSRNVSTKPYLEKAVNAINDGWRARVANLVLVDSKYSIRLNLGNQFMERMIMITQTREERDSADTIAPDYAEDLESAAIKAYEDVTVDPAEKYVQEQANEVLLGQILSNLVEAIPNVQYNFITKQEAEELTKDAANPYMDQAPAFFYNGQIYFVDGNITPTIAVHEFLHPLVLAINQENPDLFSTVYNEAVNLDIEQGNIIQDQMSQLNIEQNTAEYKREFIVRSLQDVVLKDLDKKVQSNALQKFLSRLFFAIKQILKGVFGAIKVSKLDQRTTLYELSEMLSYGKFKINTESISKIDFIEYYESVREILDYTASKIANVDFKKENYISEKLKRIAELMEKDLEFFKRFQEEDFAKNIVQSTGEISIPEIRKLINQGLDIKKPGNIENIGDKLNALGISLNQAKRLIESVGRISALMDHIIVDSRTINGLGNGDSITQATRAKFFSSMFNEFKSFAEELSKDFSEQESVAIYRDSPLYLDLTNIINKANTGLEITKNAQFEQTKGLVMETASMLNESIELVYNPTIKKVEDALSANPEDAYLLRKLDNLKAEKEKLIVTEDKVADMLFGEGGDSSFIEGWVLSATQSTDPIYGTLGSIVKNAYNTATANAVDLYSQLFREILPLMKTAGITGSNSIEMFRQIIELGSTNAPGVYDVNGNFIEKVDSEKTVYKFLTPTTDEAIIRHKEIENEIKQLVNSGRKSEAAEKYKELEQLEADYFYRPYSIEYYDKTSIRDFPGGEEALKRLYLIDIDIQDIQIQYTAALRYRASNSELQDILNNLKQLQIERNRLKSPINADGTEKTGVDLDVAKALQNNYRRSTDLYEEPEVNDELFKQAYNLAKDTARSLFPNDPERFQNYMEIWFKNNTTVTYTDEYKEVKSRIGEVLRASIDKVTDPVMKDLLTKKNELRLKIASLKSIYRFKNGSYEPESMNAAELQMVKDAQDAIDKLDVEIEMAKGIPPGFDKQTFEFVQKIRKLILHDYKLSTYSQVSSKELILQVRYPSLYYAYDTYSKELKDFRASQNLKGDSEITELFDKLNEMETLELTNSYIMQRNYAMDYALAKLRDSGKALTQTIIDFNDIYFCPDDEDFMLLMSVPEFKTWVETNHIKYTQKTIDGISVYSYHPLPVWKEKVIDQKYTKSYIIDGLEVNYPTSTYLQRRIKEEYKTERIVGKTIDVFGQWLPRSEEDTTNPPKDDRYKNYKYYDLKASNPALFAIMEKLKEVYIAMQMSASRSARMGMEIPRFGIEGYEVNTDLIKSNSKFQDYLKILKRRFFFVEGDEYDEGLNPTNTQADIERKMRLVSFDFFGDEISKIPVSGKFKIPYQNVSTDVITSMFKYFFSLEELKEKIKILPIVKSLQNVVNDEGNMLKDMQALNRQSFLGQGDVIFGKLKSSYVRRDMVNSFIAKHFEGENLTGFLSNAPEFLKIASGLSSFSSSIMLMGLESTLKNRINMSVNNVINLASGDMVDKSSYSKGKVWASRVLAYRIPNSYNPEAYPLEEMILDIFDPGDDTKKNYGRRITTSFLKSVMNDRPVLLAPRKYLESQGTVTLFAQYMYYQKVPQTINGVTTEIPYIEAFEKSEDNKVVLKEGIDESYAPGGAKFNMIKNRIDQRIALTNGDMTSIGKSHGDRFAVWGLVTGMRRFFPMMFMNRFGATINRKNDGTGWIESIVTGQVALMPRKNFVTGETYMGYYVSSLRFLIRLLKSKGKEVHYMTPQEKMHLRKMLTEILISTMMFLVVKLLFDYDPDDEERYAKLRAKSAPLPFFMTADEGTFNTMGYLNNKLLQMTILAQNEHNSFMPLPGLGLKSYTDLFTLKSITLAPTITGLTKILQDLYYHLSDDERAYYEKRVGPYKWQQAEAAKIFAVLGSYTGFSGSTVDPVTNIQMIESLKTR